MQRSGNTRALVVGAGIGGLTAAIALRRAGIEATVFERRADIARVQIGGGIVLWHNALRALSELDLAQPVVEAASVLERCEWRTRNGEVLGGWNVTEMNEKL